ncbi:Ubiquitin recognition factor in ER-associated degradation protein 1 [Seminavis robusta]|uniref:Ubiquitin recognition factor in ER-associated degradation protein 1 n=1 Tax=Seminavis robusta TaxID=568900 RepID=A0A9N8H7E3_9STRA|nr:Ubiquitin recognition factor in ER-associated degradation protein 1 [Seminavis robusta]|eukprot:Sro176_g077410.1 Ubiquitin recognition factor in ER-associated degradation protein 1 (385) ;mRNA; f:56004-57342
MWGGFGGMGGAGFGRSHRFEEQYHCYSVSFADKAHLEKGDKILLPPSAFDTLARLNVDYPMLFRLSAETNQTTHCGVLEFTAEEGSCYIPYWMMQNLLIQEGDVITVANVSLPKATMIKLKPQHVDFLDISNPKAVLEFALRNYTCVTKGDVIQIPYNNKNYQFELREVKPQDAACIVETDCNLEFDAPVGYKEPAPSSMGSAASSLKPDGPRSECPSPTTASSASSVTDMGDDNNNTNNDSPTGIRIVNGKIIRPDEAAANGGPTTSMMATKSGETGVQPNAAIPEKAPEVDYWAVNVGAGQGARLDGKKPAELQDAQGNVVDVRKLRAEAAARRAAEAAAAGSAMASTAGKPLPVNPSHRRHPPRPLPNPNAKTASGTNFRG